MKIEKNDLSRSLQNDANTEPKETGGIRLGVAGKLLEEVSQMGKSVKLQDLQLQSTRFVSSEGR